MKAWLVTCLGCKPSPFRVYCSIEPITCPNCGGIFTHVRGPFSKVKGVPVDYCLRIGVYKAPIID